MTYAHCRRQGRPLPVRKDITVPVTGSGSAPEVRITAEWLDVETVVPERYRLIAGDMQRVLLTATASDPDGIERLTISLNGILHDYTYSGETSVSETLTWTNDGLAGTRFSYTPAQQTEKTCKAPPLESFDIEGLDDITLLYSSTPSFDNEGVPVCPGTPWQHSGRMNAIGLNSAGEINANLYYKINIRYSADGGTCLGMSVVAELVTAELGCKIEYPARPGSRRQFLYGEYIIVWQGAFHSISLLNITRTLLMRMTTISDTGSGAK